MPPEITSFGEPAAQIDELVKTLEHLVAHHPIALLDWPDYPNAGDHFIWLGQKFLFRQRLGVSVRYECTRKNVNFQRLTTLAPEVVFVMHGGGNFGDLYTPHQRFREGIVAAFPDRRIIFMPQTVKYLDRTRMEWSARLFSLHPDLHIIARDKDSYETLTGQMGLINCYLHTDSAFALQSVVSNLVSAIGAPMENDEIYLMRQDVEAAQVLPDGIERVDWGNPDNLAALVDLGPDLKSINVAREIFQTEFDAYSWGRLCAGVRLFSSGRRIVTDRLHGHILALMMGKMHDFYDNSYGKNSAFCLSWTYQSPLVRFISPPDRLSKAIANNTVAPIS